MSYEMLAFIVVVNALATFSLWRRMASKANRGPILKKKAAKALWRSDPIVPKHDPPKIAGGQFSSLADEEDRQFFADFRDFADVMNWWLADEYTASRFRLQDLPDGDRSLNVDFDHGPVLGRCFAIYHGETRVGRIEISPGVGYRAARPEVYTSAQIDWVRFFGCGELVGFLEAVAWHVTTGNPNNDDFRDAKLSINSALTRTLWDNYRVSELDEADNQDWGELNLSFHGTASCYILRRDAPARVRA
jgi:hypothetical protein